MKQLMTKLKGAACVALVVGLALNVRAATCCRIGDASYDTIAAALATVTDDTATTITLAANVTEDVTIAASRTITLDLNGFVLKGSGSATVVNNPSGSKLTIADTCSPRPRHYFTEGSNNLWVWNNDAQETAFYVDGGLITGGKGTNKSNVNSASGTNSAGGVFCNGGSLTLTNVTLVGNQAYRGGGIGASSSCTIVATACDILHNYATYLEGGIKAYSCSLTMTDCKVVGNKAPERGGLYVYNKAGTLTRCTIADNVASTGAAGGILGWTATLKLQNCEILGNSAAKEGGGVKSYYYSGGSFTASNTVFRGNVSGQAGGAIHSTTTVALTDCTIDGNTSGASGAICNVASSASRSVTVAGATSVTNNTGGNVYLASGKVLSVKDGFSGMIGVTTATAPTADAPVALTGTCTADQHARFVPDNADYYVVNAANNVATLCLRQQITVNAPTAPEHATVAVYTNGVQLTEEGPWTIGNDVAVTAVYTAAKGYAFEDLSSARTNAFDMTQNPATVAVPTAMPFSPDDCITFASEGGFTLNGQVTWDGTLWWSTDKITWTTWTGEEISAVQSGEFYRIYVRGNADNSRICLESLGLDNRWVLTPTGENKIACSGNIETLRGATGDNPSSTQMAECCYAYMFYGCSSLTAAPELPAKTLAENCYRGMFARCISLTAAPELPVKTLAANCYRNMFGFCISLTAAPELPATTLAEYCYANMFTDCTSLTAAPELPAKTLAGYCYNSMFTGCSSLTAAPELPAETLAGYCYNSMFNSCISLTAAPELPAKTLAANCYRSMFAGCRSLTAAPELPATTLAECCYTYMFNSCSSLTAAPALDVASLTNSCCLGMFILCTNLVVNAQGPGRRWSVPATAEIASTATYGEENYWANYMFAATAGDVNMGAEIVPGTTYFVESDWKREIDLGGGMTARDYYNGDWAIVGKGELTAAQTALLKDKGVTNLWIHTGVTGVGANAFADKAFWTLQDVTLGTNCTAVGDRAFKKCYGLTNVTSQATEPAAIGNYAFSGCNSLEGLSFAGVPTFGTQAYTLQAAIYMKDGGIPKVYTMPTITINGMQEHILGKKALTDETWTDVTDFSDDDKKQYHFFKIEMR